jgi:hypothetical protein
VQTRLGRDEQIAALYTRHAARLRRAISARARGLDATLVDEACAFAWEKLLRRLDIDVTRYDAYRWIYKVALHRAWVLGRAVFREQPSGRLSGADDDRPEPPGHDVDIVETVADRVECATVREVLGELHWRERRELLRYAHGSATSRSPRSPAPATPPSTGGLTAARRRRAKPAPPASTTSAPCAERQVVRAQNIPRPWLQRR